MSGLRVWRPDGQLSFDGSHSLLRFVTTFTAVAAVGAVSIPQWAEGRPWFFTLTDDFKMYPDAAVPTFTISGTTLSWFGGGATVIRVYAGVY